MRQGDPLAHPEHSPMATAWEEVASRLKDACPSPTLRESTVKVLQRLENLGGPLRPPTLEFKRVYKSLQWNDTDRVMQVIMALMPKTKGPKPQLVIRADTWGYVIGVLDEWISQARVFYLVSGILESALRARLDARLTDVFGANWPTVKDVVPSKLHELTERAARDAQLAAVHDLLAEAGPQPPTLEAYEQLVASLKQAIAPAVELATASAADFVRGLSFGALRMFFEKKTLWSGKAQLQELFRGQEGTDSPPQRDRLLAVLRVMNEVRNDIAHYRPLRYLSFEEPLFAAATLARWFGEDLQHIYSSIDTRHTTELATLLLAVPDSEWVPPQVAAACAMDGCSVQPPHEWMMDRAPLDREDMKHANLKRACLYHRVAIRAALHRPEGT